MRVRKPVQVICIDCGCEFTAYSTKALRCEECKEYHLLRLKRESQARQRSPYKRKEKPKMSIGEVLTMLKDYNEENGTNLSYGKFVLLLERGFVN